MRKRKLNFFILEIVREGRKMVERNESKRLEEKWKL